MLAKSNADYGGDVRRVVDTVRASAYFQSIPAMIRAIEHLLDAGASVPQVLRTKDRIQNPLDSGYRDVLMNLECPNTDGLVVELQVSCGGVAVSEGRCLAFAFSTIAPWPPPVISCTWRRSSPSSMRPTRYVR